MCRSSELTQLACYPLAPQDCTQPWLASVQRGRCLPLFRAAHRWQRLEAVGKGTSPLFLVPVWSLPTCHGSCPGQKPLGSHGLSKGTEVGLVLSRIRLFLSFEQQVNKDFFFLFLFFWKGRFKKLLGIYSPKKKKKRWRQMFLCTSKVHSDRKILCGWEGHWRKNRRNRPERKKRG